MILCIKMNLVFFKSELFAPKVVKRNLTFSFLFIHDLFFPPLNLQIRGNHIFSTTCLYTLRVCMRVRACVFLCIEITQTDMRTDTDAELCFTGPSGLTQQQG